MTAEGDILSKFKLLSETTYRDSSAKSLQQETPYDGIYEGFLSAEEEADDLFNTFLKKASGKKEDSKRALQMYEQLDESKERKEQQQQHQEQRSQKTNFIKKALSKLINRTQENVSKEAGKFVSSDSNKETKQQKSKFSVFGQEAKFVGSLIVDKEQDLEERMSNDRRSQSNQGWQGTDRRSGRIDRRAETADMRPDYASSLISKVAKISVSNNTSDMEAIIKSDELSNHELVELFKNYVNRSVQENKASSETLSKLLASAGIHSGSDVESMQKVERKQLENIFVNFIKETSASSLETQDDSASKVIVEFAAAINPEYMTRDELEELFVRYCRTISVKYPDAFNDLSAILSSALPKAFVDKSGEVQSNAVIANFRASINPEYMTRDELEEIFVRFVREVSINAPGAWAEMQGILTNAVATAFAPDVSMDDQSRAAIANFRMAISPENMTSDQLEELFVRFAREVSIKFPAAWAELSGILNNALPHAFAPDTTMDDSSRSAISNFRMAINPESMTRDQLEELFTRFVREVSIKFPAAWTEMQGILSTALPNAFAPDTTMDDSSRSAIANFRASINPDYMKRDELEELFTRFVREVSVQFPAAFSILNGILSQALPNAYVEPKPDIDNYSMAVLDSFQGAIKPDVMTYDQLQKVFSKFAGLISNEYPAAQQILGTMLMSALGNAFVPDESMDDQSRAAIAGFGQAIKPEFMTRDQLEELFIRFSREVSVKYPAAWAELQGLLNNALPHAFAPDTTMDDSSRAAIAGLSQALKPEVMTRDQLEELFIRFSREVSVHFPAAWVELQGMLSVAVANAFVPDTTMDDSSRAAIAGFAQVIKPEFMTRDQLEELFVRFSREISVQFPAAWAELQGILTQALPNAYQPDTTMDDSSRAAIAGFSQAIKPEIMTRDQLEELFVRFSREVSVQFPAAWAQLQGMLSVAVSNAFVPDTTMDDSSRGAIASFSQAVKPQFMTREQLEELFVRCSREISVQFPAAWAELQGMLNAALPEAFVPDTTMDDSSRAAIAGFEQAIKPEYMTRDQLEELFVRFSREVSVQFPAAWAQLQGILSSALPNAYVPDTTMDDDTRNLIGQFQSEVLNNDFTEKELETLFANYMRQVPLRFSVVKSIIENTTKNKRGDAETKDKETIKIQNDYEALDKDFKRVSEASNELNLEAQQVSKDLKASDKKEDIDENIQKLRKIQAQKSALDGLYTISKTSIDSNIKATQKVDDDYTQKLQLSFERKDDRQLFEIDTKKLSSWDMLRLLRRKEVLGVMDELPKEALVESLYVVPKYILKRVLTGLTTEDMCRVLFNARFPEALLRSMPRKKALELLPSAEEMLPILMNMGHIAGFKNGTDLVENVIINSLKVEPEQNPTRTQEEIMPFVMEQLIGKTPRNADAVHPVQGKQSPIDKAMADITEDSAVMNDLTERQNIKDLSDEDIKPFVDPEKHPDMDRARADISTDENLLKQMMQPKKLQNSTMKGKIEHKYQRPESLLPDQLQELAQETLKKFGDDESRDILAAKRGTSRQMLEFLDSLKKVDGLAAAKQAVSVLSVSQTKAVAKATLPFLETKHIVKISQFYGRSNKEMVKQMPRYALEGLIKNLPKHYMIQGFKLLDKSMITGVLKTQSSQTIARVASELLDRNTVKDTAFKKKGFV